VKVTIGISRKSKQAITELSAMGRQIGNAINTGLHEGAEFTAAHIEENYLTGQALRARTGLLRASIMGGLIRAFEAVVGVAPGSGVMDYAWLLTDEEKTIVPKRAKYLAIPIGENRTGAVAKYGSPREVPGGFFVRTRTGALLFGVKRGKRGKFRPLFVLKKSVFVQGSGALPDGVMDKEDDIAGQIEKRIDEVTNG